MDEEAAKLCTYLVGLEQVNGSVPQFYSDLPRDIRSPQTQYFRGGITICT